MVNLSKCGKRLKNVQKKGFLIKIYKLLALVEEKHIRVTDGVMFHCNP